MHHTQDPGPEENLPVMCFCVCVTVMYLCEIISGLLIGQDDPKYEDNLKNKEDHKKEDEPKPHYSGRGGLAHSLQCFTAFKIQYVRQGAQNGWQGM